MELLVVNDQYQLEVNPLALGISSVKAVMDEDRSISKERAIKRLLFIALMYTPHLDYFLDNPDEELRQEIILADIGVSGKKHFLSNKTKACAKWFKDTTKNDIRVVLYNAASSAADTVRRQLDDTDTLLKKEKKNGDPVYSLKDVLTTLNMIPETMDKLDAAREKIIAQKVEGRTSFGAREKNMFEDGIGLD